MGLLQHCRAFVFPPMVGTMSMVLLEALDIDAPTPDSLPRPSDPLRRVRPLRRALPPGRGWVTRRSRRLHVPVLSLHHNVNTAHLASLVVPGYSAVACASRVPQRSVTMSQVEKLEQTVAPLSPEELAAFRSWFVAFDAAEWDRQIEIDSEAGKLDRLAQDAID